MVRLKRRLFYERCPFLFFRLGLADSESSEDEKS